MANIKRSLYSVAINGQGYVLRGAPQSPARSMVEAPLRGLGPAEDTIDLNYKDSSSFLPWAQTDWSGGYQFEKWTDNAGFLSGSGLEYIEKFGELTLLNDKSATLKSFGTGFTFGASNEFNGSMLVGITKGSGASELWNVDTSDVFVGITGGTWANVDAVNAIDELQGLAFIGVNASSGSPLKTYDASAIADITLAGDLASSTNIRMVVRIEERLYVAGFTGTAADGDAMMFSDDAGVTWTSLITKTGRNRTITQGIDNFGSLYFLIEDGFRTELWVVNNTIVTQIYRWSNLTSPFLSVWNGNVYIQGLAGNGKLRVYKWDGASLRVIFEERADDLTLSPSRSINWKENLYSFGLVYDGVISFPSYAFQTGANDQLPFAVWGSASSQVPYFYGLDGSSNLVITKLDTAAYIISSNTITGRFDANKVAVDKLWHSVTVLFKQLVADQTIQIEYSVDDGSTFTSIGTITFASTGDGANTEETLFFAANTSSRKIQLRITLGSDGTNTPTIQAFTTRYLILGDNRFAWAMELTAYNKLMLLDGKTSEPKDADELKQLLHVAKWKRQIVELQDVDYQETAIDDGAGMTAAATSVTVDRTNGFPEQGRIKINQEEILYTGKTATSFTGLTRGARGTLAAAHSDDDVVSTKYDVLITSVSEITTPEAEATLREAVMRVNMLEV